MIYGLDTRLRVGNVGGDTAVRSSFVDWRKLDHQSRLRLVERRLKPATDFIDGFPPAP